MLKDISDFLQKQEGAYDYFPMGKEQAKLPKQWVVNVAASLLGGIFNDWVKEQIERRNKRVAIERDVMINLDPDIAAAFNSSSAVSRKCHTASIYTNPPFITQSARATATRC
jgi:hypothetical protein